ncbi:TonB-dependent receptor [uncultured Flavobacterium sp.]|uniref:SusC/RagA family TonB-linked outer membrane protein n=1 Tax=Flavobacterium sp. XS1P27 TaxID=3401724 RepID=UPI0028EC79A8|nr:TonB-dependent receptor [uncultured Flavobacterium sp.]
MKKLLSNLIHWNGNHRAIPLLLFLLLTSNFITAQAKVQGIVTDEKGLTIPGVNVLVIGSSKSASTDIDGKYEIDAPVNATLSFSFIGFETQNIAVKGKSKINVSLKSTSQNLQEVVVIGYGTQKRGDITSAISSVKAKDLENLKQVSVDQMLQGKAAGVTVTSNSGQPGSNTSVKIRGISSLGGTNEPLYVVDGVPISGDATSKSTTGKPLVGNDFSEGSTSTGNSSVSPIAFLNPNDIESMDILKDASATAIYGSRGANGVVIITTKSGKKGSGKLTYDHSYSIQEQTNLIDVLDLQGYARLQNGLIDALTPTALKNDNFSHPELLGKGTNWQDEIYRIAIMKSHQLSISGGKEGVSYYVSGGYIDQEGTVIGSGFKKYTFRTNVDAKVKDWLKVGAFVNTGITNENITLNGSQNGIVSTSLLSTPDVVVYNADGTYAGPPTNSQGIYFRNPIAEALSNTNKLVRKNFSGNVFTEARLMKGLEYRFEIGGYAEFSEGNEFRPTYNWGAASNNTASLTSRTNSFYSLNIKNLLTYKTEIGKHSFNILAGQEANEGNWKGLAVTGIGFFDNSLPELPVAAELQKVEPGFAYSGSQRLYSLFGKAVYDYGGRYSISGSIRADGSSKFAKGNKWGYFPAISGSWKLSNEEFMQDFNAVKNIKVRAGYGETGNQQIANNLYAPALTLVQSPLGAGFQLSRSPNPELTWESQKQINIGLDFSLFNSGLNASIDVYKKTSKDFLYQIPLPLFLTGSGDGGGVASAFGNIGTLENKGIEMSVNYSTKLDSGFSWNSTLVVSKYVNKLVEISNSSLLIKYALINDYTRKPITKTLVGGPIGTFYGLNSLGIYTSDADASAGPKNGFGASPVDFIAGDMKYADNNNDGVINELDYTTIGDPNPDFTFGFTNNFAYKNFDFSVFLQGSVGNDLFNLTRRAGTSNSNLYQNQFASALDFYSPSNLDASLPRPTSYDHPNLIFSDRFVEDGSYLRVQNITVGYTLPTDIISQAKLTRLKLYASVQNLYTFTKYTGYDPEVGSFNQDALLSGVDNGRYPTPRVISVGVNVEF